MAGDDVLNGCNHVSGLSCRGALVIDGKARRISVFSVRCRFCRRLDGKDTCQMNRTRAPRGRSVNGIV